MPTRAWDMAPSPPESPLESFEVPPHSDHPRKKIHCENTLVARKVPNWRGQRNGNGRCHNAAEESYWG